MEVHKDKQAPTVFRGLGLCPQPPPTRTSPFTRICPDLAGGHIDQVAPNVSKGQRLFRHNDLLAGDKAYEHGTYPWQHLSCSLNRLSLNT